jgi:hypothetical protein
LLSSSCCCALLFVLFNFPFDIARFSFALRSSPSQCYSSFRVAILLFALLGSPLHAAKNVLSCYLEC